MIDVFPLAPKGERFGSMKHLSFYFTILPQVFPLWGLGGKRQSNTPSV